MTETSAPPPFNITAAIATAAAAIPASAALGFMTPPSWHWLSLAPSLAYAPFFVRALRIRRGRRS